MLRPHLGSAERYCDTSATPAPRPLGGGDLQPDQSGGQSPKSPLEKSKHRHASSSQGPHCRDPSLSLGPPGGVPPPHDLWQPGIIMGRTYPGARHTGSNFLTGFCTQMQLDPTCSGGAHGVYPASQVGGGASARMDNMHMQTRSMACRGGGERRGLCVLTS